MNLYVLRHANALNVGEQGILADEERPLSDEGRQRVALLAKALKRLGQSFDHILSSPLRRAMETAQELIDHLDTPLPDVTFWEELAPGGKSKKLAKKLLTLDGQEVLLVGHEPSLSQHIAWLIGDKDANIELSKTGLACVRCEGVPQKGGGALAWLITPKWLEAMAGG